MFLLLQSSWQKRTSFKSSIYKVGHFTVVLDIKSVLTQWTRLSHVFHCKLSTRPKDCYPLPPKKCERQAIVFCFVFCDGELVDQIPDELIQQFFFFFLIPVVKCLVFIYSIDEWRFLVRSGWIVFAISLLKYHTFHGMLSSGYRSKTIVKGLGNPYRIPIRQYRDILLPNCCTRNTTATTTKNVPQASFL